MARSSANYGFKTRASLKESAGMRESCTSLPGRGNSERESRVGRGFIGVFKVPYRA